MKILIIHDRFQFRGGAERLILILARALKADLMTEFWITADTFDKSEVPHQLFILDKGEAPWIVWRYFRAHLNYLFKTRQIIRRYDLIIFSGNNCLTASFHCRKKTKKILYCHSPVRHVFDLWKFARQEQTQLWKKIIYYDIGAWGIRLIYWLGLKQMDQIIVNSQTIKYRLQNFIHQKTNAVIYPPIDTQKFKWLEAGDYYLSFGRLERLKRIPDIIKAFQQLPDKKLIVISGGPDLDKVKKMAANYPNIQVIGWVSDAELANYIGRCRATIYVPINEDFGMTPLESMAAGKPCIGIHEGGLTETIIDEVNGKFIPANYSTTDIISAINWMTADRALAMKDNCIAQAQKFNESRFINQIKEAIQQVTTKN